MGIIVLSLAATAMHMPASGPQLGRTAIHASSRSPARRFSGAEASATITVRIISHPARIGQGLPPPLPAMEPRAATIAAADGTPVSALIYDFE